MAAKGKRPMKGSLGTSFIIEKIPGIKRISCSNCINYEEDRSCSAKGVSIMEIGYDFWNQCDKFDLSSKYDSEEESILALKKLEKWGINAYIINPDGCINPYRVNVLESKNTNFSYNYASEKLKVDRTMTILCFLVPIIGIIIYCINVSTSPIQSKRCLTISIYGIVIGTIITLLLS